MPSYKPLIDASLAEFDENGFQTVFPISPFGNSETRAERIERWIGLGVFDPDCPSCQPTLEHPTLNYFGPSHKPNSFCRSGKRPHCTCDGCF